MRIVTSTPKIGEHLLSAYDVSGAVLSTFFLYYFVYSLWRSYEVGTVIAPI